MLSLDKKPREKLYLQDIRVSARCWWHLAAGQTKTDHPNLPREPEESGLACALLARQGWPARVFDKQWD